MKTELARSLNNFLSLLIVAGIFYFLIPLVSLVLLLPGALLLLSALDYRTQNRKPDYLFGLETGNEFLSRKGGIWLLLKYPVIFLGLVFDLVIWILNGVLVLFRFFTDALLLVREVLFWVFHAVIWFLGLFVPPLVIVFRSFIHYFLRWPWWIYRCTFHNTKLAFYWLFLRIAFRGAFLALFILLIFYGTAVIIEVYPLIYVGLAFALLPLTWAYTEIGALRQRDNQITSYKRVRKLFSRGMESVRAVLFYLSSLVVLLVLQILLYMLGWIPDVGFSLLGISLNIGTLISIVILFMAVILLFSKFLIPPYILQDRKHENNLSSSLYFLGIIGRKFLRYLFAHVPALVFGVFLMLLPAIIMITAGWISINIKNTVLDTRINSMVQKEKKAEGIEAYRIGARTDQLRYYREYPFNFISGFRGIKEEMKRNQWLSANIDSSLENIRRSERMFNQDVDSLKNEISLLEAKTDSISKIRADLRKQNLQQKIEEFNIWKLSRQQDIFRETARLESSKNLVKQLPLVFLFSAIWASLLGGLILAVFISYLGNLYFELYSLGEDSKPTYLRQLFHKFREKDRNQPLLGFTLLFILLTGMGIAWFFLYLSN